MATPQLNINRNALGARLNWFDCVVASVTGSNASNYGWAPNTLRLDCWSESLTQLSGTII